MVLEPESGSPGSSVPDGIVELLGVEELLGAPFLVLLVLEEGGRRAMIEKRMDGVHYTNQYAVYSIIIGE